jgi:hypothetical protein
MQRIRIPVSLLIIWLFVFYNLERMSRMIDISQVAYVAVPVVAAFILLIPRLGQINFAISTVITACLFVVAELVWLVIVQQWPQSFDFAMLLVEIAALTFTIWLTRQVSLGMREFESAVVNITLGQVGERRSRQGEMYREVKRARDHHRPLNLIAVRADESALPATIDRMVKEAQAAMIHQYVVASLSKTLSDELEDYNLIARARDYLLVMLPEVSPERLGEVTKRLRRAASERVGVPLHIGTASMSADVRTLEALVQEAEASMMAEATAPKSKTSTIHPTTPIAKPLAIADGVNVTHEH